MGGAEDSELRAPSPEPIARKPVTPPPSRGSTCCVFEPRAGRAERMARWETPSRVVRGPDGLGRDQPMTTLSSRMTRTLGAVILGTALSSPAFAIDDRENTSPTGWLWRIHHTSAQI